MDIKQSKAFTYTQISVTPEVGLKEEPKNFLINKVSEIAKKYTNEDIEFFVTGEDVMMTYISKFILKDIVVLVPVVILVILFILLFSFKSFIKQFIVLVPVLISTAWDTWTYGISWSTIYFC